MFQNQNKPNSSFNPIDRESTIFSWALSGFLLWEFNQFGVLFNSEGYTFDGSTIQTTNEFVDLVSPSIIWQ